MTQQARFRCAACGGEFPSQEALNAHAQQKHAPPPNEFRCAACGTVFANQQERQEHAAGEHAQR
jgi:uncharacterized Zn finger protein